MHENEFAVTDIPCTGVEGTASGPIRRPMEKSPGSITSSETVPAESCQAESAPDMYAQTGERAKRFS